MSTANMTGRSAGSRKKTGLVWKILGGLVAVILILGLFAEFGLRWYIKDNIEDTLKEQAAASRVQMQADPSVTMGSRSVVLGLLGGRIPQLDMEIPSSLQVSYENNDKSRPVVAGDPATTIHATDIALNGSSQEDMILGSLEVETVLPAEAMLAQAQQTMAESKQEQQQDGGLEGLVQQALRVTDITTDEANQTLTFQLGGGLADLVLRPRVEDGRITMDTTDVKFLGFSLPSAIVDAIGEQIAQQAEEAGNLGDHLRMSDARVTDEGLKVVMQGNDVSMAELARSLNEARGAADGTVRGGDGSASTGRAGEGHGAGADGELGAADHGAARPDAAQEQDSVTIPEPGAVGSSERR
ncbi:DUF2993 domain-containing protein [Corynebacterium sp. zg254]|uniref:DUF2993 domain-containing protein n=1 Tax=Corynebacterium zhongnanshanii TaxID=2768834 RepID=A0ABQ6VE45_9CORY|nr:MULTISPECIES: LmeA family phospholipid-binding protein [Corynebacterium]KAB3522702.1 DUF2993 domain-containing protein [Corynebacterium zhongnanshanii]MCR5914243.1 DUF2993 domain-containing protein [Corynebacterium sp. zg254]